MNSLPAKLGAWWGGALIHTTETLLFCAPSLKPFHGNIREFRSKGSVCFSPIVQNSQLPGRVGGRQPWLLES